jgi:hypothetical protein
VNNNVNDGTATAHAAASVVTDRGGAFMISSEAKAAGKDGGYRGWALYLAGRGGVLGPAPLEVVGSLFPFHEPGVLRSGWVSGLAVRPVEETVERYVDVCRAWGRRHYSELDGAERLADLLGRVVDAADPVGWPLFAGWRRLELPADAPARAAQLLHVLREHRGGAHLSALRLTGLSPLEAIVAGPGGPGNAAFFGWPEPFPVVDEDMLARRKRAEELTDQLVGPAYGALSPEEAGELLDLLEKLGRAAR